ncbi:MAG: hypothetical protein NC419_07405 [Muribaculaceae bacterium]|nr:hypothetical protein [Muribaculaceae bacterium]
MWKNLKQQVYTRKNVDYGQYDFTGKEWALYCMQGAAAVGIIAYFFYRSVWACPFLIPLFVVFLGKKKAQLAKRRREELKIQFKDAVLSVSANQKAGYSVENAFREAYRDMAALYGKESLICKELDYIAKGLDNNVILERLLYDLGSRSHVPDILQFADVFFIAKRSGGNMTKILAETAETIEQKITVDKEIQVLISSKKMEQKIMNAVPFLIIFYMDLTSKGFFDVLYHNLAGVFLMTICLLIYLAAYTISARLVEIEV